MSAATVLETRDLTVRLTTPSGPRPILTGVELSIHEGEMVGLVGESGSGKSMTARAIDGILPPGASAGGEVLFDGRNLLAASRREMRRIRSAEIAMVFQDPKAHVNPVRTIGDFLCESTRINLRLTRRAAAARAIGLLSDVGLPDGERLMRRYPHQLSGGMLQRVMIAAALAGDPRLLLADEPTTALDVTIQAEIMAILAELRRERRLAILFITHDLDLAAATCDRILVMYAGRIVEEQAATALFSRPLHPYTAALLMSRPRLDEVELPPAVPGRPVSAFEAPIACEFSPRCPYVRDHCRRERPALLPLAGGRVACHRAEELLGRVDRGFAETSDVAS